MKSAFKAAVCTWGVSPVDFWKMHPSDFWWMAEGKRPPRMYGRMREDEVAELYEELANDGLIRRKFDG